MPKRHVRGRPREGVELKRAPLNMRTSPAIRARLEAAAAETGRSLTQEVEARLERSFALEEMRQIIREELAIMTEEEVTRRFCAMVDWPYPEKEALNV